MDEVWTEIMLENMSDKSIADEGYTPQNKVRRLTAMAKVDTGVWALVINEDTRRKLGLRLEELRCVTVAGKPILSGITEAVKIYWKNRRRVACEAVVLPDGEEDVILGAYPMEGLDLIIDTQKEMVVGAHGDEFRDLV
jgi:hypothetical protein